MAPPWRLASKLALHLPLTLTTRVFVLFRRYDTRAYRFYRPGVKVCTRPLSLDLACTRCSPPAVSPPRRL
jgi:hypothetical protein